MSTPSLFDRLGGSQGIRSLVDAIVVRHLENPLIAKRFAPLAEDPERMAAAVHHLCGFLEAGSGGSGQYSGRDMVTAHKGMNISGEEYLAAMDDIMDALDAHGADDQTKSEMLMIGYSLKAEIMRQ